MKIDKSQIAVSNYVITSDLCSFPRGKLITDNYMNTIAQVGYWLFETIQYIEDS